MLIVVTGGIGSGKSVACRFICDQYGFALYEADSKVKELYFKYPELLDNLEQELCCNFRNDKGAFVPSFLAEKIFNDKSALDKLESIVFPFLLRDFNEFSSEYGPDIVFESATVLEKKEFEDFGDLLILIDADQEIRMERACTRDHADRAKIQARMANQRLMNAISDKSIADFPWDSDFARAFRRVNYIVINNESISQLKQKLSELMDEILYSRK